MVDGHTAATDFLMAMQSALGWKAFCIDGVPWCRYGIATAMTIPLSEIHPVGRSQAERILRESGCLLAQFPTSANTGAVCRQYMLRDKAYSEASLQRQFRQMMRRGEQHLTFRELTWDELATAGPGALEAYRSRRGMKTPVARHTWREACEKGEAAAQFIIYGCHHGDELAGFEIFWRQPPGYRSVCTVVHPGFFRFGAANLLLYRSGRALIARDDCDYVCFGRSGIPAIEGNDRFNRHAGLLVEPLHMAVVLHPRLRWLGRIAHHFEAIAAVAATNPDLLPE